jgi:hypothetical protein
MLSDSFLRTRSARGWCREKPSGICTNASTPNRPFVNGPAAAIMTG